jgi:hypothetical protein
MGIKRIYGRMLHSYTTIDNPPPGPFNGPFNKGGVGTIGESTG